ncbi:hypothetical protein GCM10020256_03210 [Streptomyces thermocoprophilus]
MGGEGWDAGFGVPRGRLRSARFPAPLSGRPGFVVHRGPVGGLVAQFPAPLGRALGEAPRGAGWRDPPPRRYPPRVPLLRRGAGRGACGVCLVCDRSWGSHLVRLTAPG